MKGWIKSTGCAYLLAMGCFAHAQEGYPQKPVVMIVPAAPGGAGDVVARAINSELSTILGRTVIIDNKPGASGIIGTTIAARAAPDGYTILMAPPPAIVVEPHYRKLDYDPLKDFAPVSLVTTSPQILVVHPSVPVASVKDLIALARTKPLNFSSAGQGAPSGLAGEIFSKLTGARMTHVPFKGAGPALVALLSGEVELQFAPLPVALPYINDRRLKALAVTSPRRSTVAPQIPTLLEEKIPVDIVSFYGVLAPAHTPQPVIGILHQAIVKALKSPRTVEFFQKGGSEVVGNTPEEFSVYLRQQYENFGSIVRSLGPRS